MAWTYKGIQMNHYLILRLTNAAIDLDQRGQGNLAALLTEAIDEMEKLEGDESEKAYPGRYLFGDGS
jgi:uncharacterized protein (DUF1015 family)